MRKDPAFGQLGLARADTGRMRASPSTAWSLTEYPLGRVHVERLVSGVVVRLEVYSGGGFVTSTAVWRLAGRAVAMAEAGRG